ncbi:MAG: DUF2142 domain-containing protein [Clostridia bacterium]|nr:DUF2142 domain-containing protein [Clostridia bacterium]
MERGKLRGTLGKHGKNIATAAALALFALTALLFFFRILRSGAGIPATTTAVIYISAACLAIGGLVCFRFAVSKSDMKPERIFTVFMIAAGLVYTVVFLPFTVPDEPAHYLSAYRISNYLTLNFDQFGDGRLLIRNADLELFASLRSTRLSPEYYASVAKGCDFFVSGAGASFIPAEFVSAAPFGYIASALGISLGRMLHFGAVPTFYIGRLANLALYILAVRFAIKRVPYGKTAFFIIASLPMAIHLAASYSYDPSVIALALLFVSQVLYMREKPEKASAKDILLCALWAVLLAPSKLVYFPLLFLVFIIPSDKLNANKRVSAAIKVGVVLLGAAALLLIQGGSLFSAFGGGKCTWTDGRLYSLSDVFAHPFASLGMLFGTIAKKGGFYLASMTCSHTGWHQLAMPFYVWLPALALLFASLLPSEDEPRGSLTGKSRISALVIWIVSAAAVMAAMLLTWTPVSSGVIEGVCGRYFIPLLPLLLIALRFRRFTLPAKSGRYIVWAGIFFGTLMPFIYFGMIF